MSGSSAPRRTLGKRCPRCGLGHRMEAAACDRCGRAFQTVIKPRSAPDRGASARWWKRRGWSVSGLAALAGLNHAPAR